jgi:gamma-glutamyltranspeptidase/glutathione hydrolase
MGDRITGRAFATRSEVIARHGMACTSQPLATQVAVEILKRGGTAVDAAIAANAVLGVVEPTGCGIGGDLLALVWDPKTKRLYGLNASGRSPKRLTLDEFRRRNLTRIPSYYYWERNVAALAQFPNVQAVYAPNGRTPRKGDVFRNPQLAATLEKIAVGGREAFYRGDIARTIADFIARQGGFLDVEDLAAHRSEWVEPISTNYRGYDVWELPPNSQGLAALQMLNILEGYDLAKFGFGSREHIHYFVEAKKLAYEDRARFYADPDFVKVPVAELLSKAYAAERRKLIHPTRAGARYEAGEPVLRAGDTVYLTTADREGMMVSLIQSNYRGMGSGMVPDGLGFMLHNRGELFSLETSHANVYAPGKRPFHTIIPAFVTKDGRPWMSFGVMGGGFQPLGHVQILINIIDFGMNLQEAGDAPRIDHQGSSEPTGERATGVGVITLETGFAYEVVRELIRSGHRVGFAVGDYGGYQAIRWDADQGVYYGASESRKDGQAAGY